MQKRFHIWITGSILALAALVALCAFVLRAVQFSEIQHTSKISQNLWVVYMDARAESFPWDRLVRVSREQHLAVNFGPYQKTDFGTKPQPTINPLNADMGQASCILKNRATSSK